MSELSLFMMSQKHSKNSHAQPLATSRDTETITSKRQSIVEEDEEQNTSHHILQRYLQHNRIGSSNDQRASISSGPRPSMGTATHHSDYNNLTPLTSINIAQDDSRPRNHGPIVSESGRTEIDETDEDDIGHVELEIPKETTTNLQTLSANAQSKISTPHY